MTNVPVLVGAAAVQVTAEPGDGLDCGSLLVEAARQALTDAAGTQLASHVDLVLVTRGLSMLDDGAARIADAIGSPEASVVAYEVGIPQQTLLNRAINAIRSGQARVVVVAGAETKRRDDLARRAGLTLPPPPPGPGRCDQLLAPEGEIVARPEIDVGAVAPVQQYALIDSARRAAYGWSLAEHRDDIAELWESFNRVAASNLAAAFPAPQTKAELRDPSPTNRMLAFPYNKWHNSQWGVDQGSALVITSLEVARSCQIPSDRFVFPLVGVESSQSLSLSRRAEMHRWPAMSVLGAAAAEHLGWPLTEVDATELYSCFPAAVRVQQTELGLAPDAPATITGGMSFAGGPFNNFVFQATVAMVQRLRSQTATTGLVTAVSGLLTKPGLAVWSTRRPDGEVLIADLAEQAAAVTETVPIDDEPAGPGTVASYTVVPVDEVPSRVVAIIDLDSGARAVAAVTDTALGQRVVEEEFIGARVAVTGRHFEL
jgi:acetyl-CoA C-acetyltransferase